MHAEKMRALSVRIKTSHTLQLTHTLTTRLRFALFKVENGWTRQSLSEVENLYYRRHMSVAHTPSKNGGRCTPPDRHTWIQTSSAVSRASPSPAQPYGQLIGSLDNSTYAEFWNRLDTVRQSPGQASSGSAPTADASKLAVDTTLSGRTVQTATASAPRQVLNSESTSAHMPSSDMPSTTPDSSFPGKHMVDNTADESMNGPIPTDAHPSKRLKRDASDMAP